MGGFGGGLEPAAAAAAAAGARVLVVGSGGIGCELLKTLVLSGFADIDLVDLDTIELSNLNRQFLFRRRHVGRSKAEVAREAVLKFAPPGTKIRAHHGNVKEPMFSVDYVKGFAVVLNGLDNLEARQHVNRLCLAAEVPLVESGTAGYLGQVTVHLKGRTECFECRPTPKPKKYPVCTLRNTPEKPIHCIVWAKDMLLARLFGPREAGTDLEEGDDPEMYLLKDSEDPHTFARRIYENTFVRDVERLRGIEEYWKLREPPTPLPLAEALGTEGWTPAPAASPSASASGVLGLRNKQADLGLREEALVFLEAVRLFVEHRRGEIGSHEFDKDDDLAMEIVAAAANLRSRSFGIPPQSHFAAKGMAGNIVHAIATTNAITAGLIVVQALRILMGRPETTHMTYINERPSNRKFLVPVENAGPNKACFVCQKATVRLRADLGVVTLGELVRGVAKHRLGFNEPNINAGAKVLYEEGGLEADEVATYAARLGLALHEAPLLVVDGDLLELEDFSQDLRCQLQISHVEDFGEEEAPEGWVLDGSVALPEPGGEERGTEGGGAGEDEPQAKKRKVSGKEVAAVTVESDSDLEILS